MVKGGGSGFWSLLKIGEILFRFKGVISITLIIVLVTCFGSLRESIKEKNMFPFIKNVGGTILNHDTNLYIESVKLEKQGGVIINGNYNNDGFIGKIKFYFEIFKSLGKALLSLWYLYFFIFLFYKLAPYITNNESASLGNLSLIIIFLVVLQMITNFVLIDSDSYVVDGKVYEFTNSEKLMPFKGTLKFFSSLNFVFNPIYKSVENTDNIYLNETINLV